MPFRRYLVYAVPALAALALGCGGGTESDSAGAPATVGSAVEEVFQVDPSTAAMITGKVLFDGAPPARRPVNMGSDEDCKKLHDGPVLSEQIVVNDNGTLRNVYVWIKQGLEGKKFPVPEEKVHIDQQGCVYVPHVVGVMVGQTLSVSNSDPTLHNVHPLPRSNAEWNKSQAAGAGPIEQVFTKPELMIPVKCNIHPWMRAYVNVSPHPFFAVTGEDGSFAISGLPPGNYVVEFVHERLGNQQVEVTVGPGETVEVEAKYSS